MKLEDHDLKYSGSDDEPLELSMDQYQDPSFWSDLATQSRDYPEFAAFLRYLSWRTLGDRLE